MPKYPCIPCLFIPDWPMRLTYRKKLISTKHILLLLWNMFVMERMSKIQDGDQERNRSVKIYTIEAIYSGKITIILFALDVSDSIWNARSYPTSPHTSVNHWFIWRMAMLSLICWMDSHFFWTLFMDFVQQINATSSYPFGSLTNSRDKNLSWAKSVWENQMNNNIWNWTLSKELTVK